MNQKQEAWVGGGTLKALQTDERVMCEPLIDAAEAAVILKVHPVTIRAMAARGEIPAMKIGRVWRFRASALDEWLTAQLKSSRHPHPVTEEL